MLFANRSVTAPRTIQITGSAIPCGSHSPILAKSFPYPATENWQKAIGAHDIWLSGTVTMEIPPVGKRVFTIVMTLHAEDRYNFNPGAADIATGIPDSANGIFEVTGLAQQYMNYSTLVRHVRWTGATAEPAQVTELSQGRQRSPHDNLRLRNRL